MIITQIKEFTLLWCHKRRTFETQTEDGISLEQFLISWKMMTSCSFCVKCPFHLCLWRLYAVPSVLVCCAFGAYMLCLRRLYAMPLEFQDANNRKKSFVPFSREKKTLSNDSKCLRGFALTLYISNGNISEDATFLTAFFQRSHFTFSNCLLSFAPADSRQLCTFV